MYVTEVVAQVVLVKVPRALFCPHRVIKVTIVHGRYEGVGGIHGHSVTRILLGVKVGHRHCLDHLGILVLILIIIRNRKVIISM